MDIPDRLVIELGENYHPFVYLKTDSKRQPVSVRLREYQENLTQLYVGHEVTDFEWVETGDAQSGATRVQSERLLVAWHDKQRCRRCARIAETEQRDHLLDAHLAEDADAAIDRVQSFYQDYICSWDDYPEALNPKLDNMLRRQRFHARRMGVDLLRQWLSAAARYVHARMHQTWIEEDVFAKTRSQLNAMRMWGTFDIDGDDALPTSGENKMTRERVTHFAGKDDVTSIEAAERSADLRYHALEPGKRLATSGEIGMSGCEQAIAYRTTELRAELPQLRSRLVAVTRQLRGA